MSVAFVKEPNEDQVEVLPDRPLGTEPNFVTPRGLDLLDAALGDLVARHEAARAADDKLALAALERDLRYYRARRASAEVIEPDPGKETVQFGSKVSIERSDGRTQEFHIVGIDEADPAAGLISFISPIARSLLGREIGDAVTAGRDEAEIVAIDR